MKIKFYERDGIGNFIIDDKRMECIKAHDIERNAEKDIDMIDVTITISILAKDFETVEELKELIKTPVAGTTDVTILLDGEKINHLENHG